MQSRKVERIKFVVDGGDPDNPADVRHCWKFDLNDHWDYYEFGKEAGQSFAIPKPQPMPQGGVRPVLIQPTPPDRRN